jgi:hypothetical protein
MNAKPLLVALVLIGGGLTMQSCFGGGRSSPVYGQSYGQPYPLYRSYPVYRPYPVYANYRSNQGEHRDQDRDEAQYHHDVDHDQGHRDRHDNQSQDAN